MDTAFKIHGHKGFALWKVKQRLMAMGMTKNHSLWISTCIQRWIKCNGVLWTIDRLKAIKLAFIQYKGRAIKPIPWLSRNSDGIPKGLFSCLTKYKWSKVVRFLNLHNLFVLDQVTKAQAKKFLEAVKRPPVDPMALAYACQLVRSGYLADKEADKLSWSKPDPIVNSNPSTYQPYADVCLRFLPPVPKKIYRESVDDPSNDRLRADMAQDCLDFLRISFNRNLLGPYLVDLFAPMRVGLLMKPGIVADPLARLAGGAIGITQEPGGKLRCYAAPFLPYQLVLKPFKKALESRIKKITTDCTYDQSKGPKQVQVWLTEDPERYITAFDLSNATDTFPLDLQMSWLNSTGISRIQLEIFEKISGLPWVPMESAVSSGFPGEMVKWTVGQPLGLNGSFPAFALTHNYLLRGIEKSIFGEVRNDFFVLGDDVVIKDELTAMKYHSVLTSLGIGISESKSLCSNVLSEFGGKLITDTGMNEGTKLSKATKNSVIELGRTYGPSSRSMVQKVVNNDPLIEALICIPASVGGLGWGTQSLDDALSPRIHAELFGALTRVKEDKELLPRRLKAEVQAAVYGRLGFSLADFSTAAVSEIPMSALRKLVPTELSKHCRKLMEANAYIVCSRQLQEVERFALSSLANGDYNSHATGIRVGKTLKGIKTLIESRYQPTTPDSGSIKISNLKKDAVLGSELQSSRDTVVDMLSHYFDQIRSNSPLSFLSRKELLQDVYEIKPDQVEIIEKPTGEKQTETDMFGNTKQRAVYRKIEVPKWHLRPFEDRWAVIESLGEFLENLHISDDLED